MKKLASALFLLTLIGGFSSVPTRARAVPKLNVKVFIGVGSTTLVPRLPSFELDSGQRVGGRQPSTFLSWQGGLTARVRSRKVFGEIGLVFSRFTFQLTEETRALSIAENPDNPEAWIPEELVGRDARFNSLDVPITAGYVPYSNPYFKLFLYGGWVSKFNIRGFIDTGEGRRGLKFRPKQITGAPLVIYQAGFRLGVQFDLGPMNFDFNYTIGLNSITKTEFRTNSHVTELNVGWLF